MNRRVALVSVWSLAVSYGFYSLADDSSDSLALDPAGSAAAIVLVADAEIPPAIHQQAERLRAQIIPVSHPKGDDKTLPGTIILPRFHEPATRDQLIAAVTRQPRSVGIGLTRNAALAIHGRQLQVIGDGPITILLAASAGRALREITLQPGDKHDLTMLRRAAIERALANFPPVVPPPPRVESGALVIAGGRPLGPEIIGRFIELAGGPDAPIIVLPIAAGDELPDDASDDTRLWSRAGATNVRSLRARTRQEVESPEFAAALKEACGVWFNGGRQWRFIDAYQGTQAEELFRDVLRRGGVIGGSSAGASIQGQYMPRGSPLGNEDMLAEGYERGLGFLPGVAIDQHFSERCRHADMSLLVRRYPQLLGIGIDESTALVVRGSTAEVIGQGKAHFYDHREGPPAGLRDHLPLSAGQTYDLVHCKLAE